MPSSVNVGWQALVSANREPAMHHRCRSGRGTKQMHKLLRTQLTLEKRAKTLRTLINESASEYHLLKAAGKLRDAKIQVLKAKIGELPLHILRTEREEQQAVKLASQIDSLTAATPSEILAECRRQRGNPNDSD